MEYEYNYITITHPDHEGGEYETNYRWFWVNDENGRGIQVEEESEGEWFEFDGFNKKSELTAWIKDSEKEIRQYRKMMEQERKHDAQQAEIEIYMSLGMSEEEAEAIVTRDIDAELRQEAKDIEAKYFADNIF